MIILVDGRYVLYRSHFTQGQLSITTPKGEVILTGAMFGLLRTVRSFDREYRGDDGSRPKFILCWEGGIPNIRTKFCPGYKANRNVSESVRDAIKSQESILQNTFKGIPQWIPNGVEADDAIASFCAQNTSEVICVISNDKDIYTSLREGVFIQKTIEDSPFTHETLAAQFNGITPELWPLAKSLAGDSSDNIPQLIARTGLKTATKMILSGELYAVLEMNLDLKERVNQNLQVIQPVTNITGWPDPQQIDVKEWNSFAEFWQMETVLIPEAPEKVITDVEYQFPGNEIINKMMGRK